MRAELQFLLWAIHLPGTLLRKVLKPTCNLVWGRKPAALGGSANTRLEQVSKHCMNITFIGLHGIIQLPTRLHLIFLSSLRSQCISALFKSWHTLILHYQPSQGYVCRHRLGFTPFSCPDPNCLPKTCQERATPISTLFTSRHFAQIPISGNLPSAHPYEPWGRGSVRGRQPREAPPRRRREAAGPGPEEEGSGQRRLAAQGEGSAVRGERWRGRGGKGKEWRRDQSGRSSQHAPVELQQGGGGSGPAGREVKRSEARPFFQAALGPRRGKVTGHPATSP